jgi:predicted PurR-regulated permease PerM
MKKTDNKEELKRYFVFGIIFLLLFLSFKIIQPYIVVIITAFILSYLVLPIFIRLNKRINKKISALICIVLIFSLVVIPLVGIIGGVKNQVQALMYNQDFVEFINNFESSPLFERFDIKMSGLSEKGVSLVLPLLFSAISYLPFLLIAMIILIFGIYHILINYDNLSSELKNYLPFEDKNEIAKEIDRSTKAIIYGSFLIAIIEFVVAGIGFYVSGVGSYLLLASVVFFFAFIPGLGPVIVWAPLAIFYALTGNWFAFFGVLITGIVLSLFIDAMLKSKILGDSSKINPFIMLIGILGGIAFFGIFGFVIGPLILIYSLKITREYFKNN